jgi:hypothetical protein
VITRETVEGVLAVPPRRAGLQASALPEAYRDLLEVAEDAGRRVPLARRRTGTAHPLNRMLVRNSVKATRSACSAARSPDESSNAKTMAAL